jgi:hypothetical protein
MTRAILKSSRILVGCEYSAVVRDAFRAKGHNAWSCDILPTEGDPRWHIQGDVLQVLDDGWDMMIAHPPCTYLSNSGVRWLYEREHRWEQMREAGRFFQCLLEAKIPKICLENPIPHGHAKLPRYTQIIHPWQFRDNETKATCLWLKELPPLVPEINEKPENLRARVWRMPPGPDRQKERSRFFKGMARAMAESWG